ncbi:hypothetical protein OPU71_19640 [Niveibacterium sp. 24ML]|uniref:hypothetical protein n=1 Tax=Niveibacterium sp. 24ML TaxID=2985512 RepID=UPI00226DA85C|nr:hypothetical protein [Niveibacterium sp. 24ML]MCX9158340.1 hypothetical protein [Niveibacterium sp. 24ML]
MHPKIVLPGLRCDTPDALSALRSVQLPALAFLLGHARIRPGQAQAGTAAFAAACGTANAAPAVLRRAGEPGLPDLRPGEIWLCADPVGLHFARDQLILAEPGSLAISADEAAALAPALAEALRDAGEFVLAAPERGYLKLAAPSEAEFSDLLDVAGRPVALFLPEGPGSLRWGRIFNELQITLHDLPLNRRREAAGKRLINSLWFWGEGQSDVTPLITAAQVYSDNPVGCGLARLAGKPCATVADFATPGATLDALLLIDALDTPARFRDTSRWLDALITLEAAVFEPLAQRIRRGELKRVDIHAPGERDGIEIAVRAQSWAFWRKPRSPECLLAPTESAR